MKTVAYARASTQDQITTLDNQQEKLQQYAKLHDLEIVRVFVGSESAKSIEGREEFKQVLDLLRDGIADGLLVYKLDRLTRDVSDGASLLKEFFSEGSRYQKTLFSVSDHCDTRSAAGRMIFQMQLVIAQWERETIAERTKAALQFKIAQGDRVGEVRYGFDLTECGKKLQPNPDEQAAIQLMEQLRSEGLSFERIANALNDRGIKTKKGKDWRPTTVNRILKRVA